MLFLCAHAHIFIAIFSTLICVVVAVIYTQTAKCLDSCCCSCNFFFRKQYTDLPTHRKNIHFWSMHRIFLSEAAKTKFLLKTRSEWQLEIEREAAAKKPTALKLVRYTTLFLVNISHLYKYCETLNKMYKKYDLQSNIKWIK